MPINKNASPRVGEWCYLEKKGNVWNPISNKSYTCKRSVINFDVTSRLCLPFSLCRWNKLKFCQRCLCFFEGAVLVCWPQHKQTEIAACRRFNFKYSTHILAFLLQSHSAPLPPLNSIKTVNSLALFMRKKITPRGIRNFHRNIIPILIAFNRRTTSSFESLLHKLNTSSGSNWRLWQIKS